jgi:ribosomal protein S18 acetylase RimI-like enzyme
MMPIKLMTNPLTPELKKHIYDAFSQHAIRCTGIDGLAFEPVSLELRDDTTLIGCVVVQRFWGQLHIKYLIVAEAYRGRGYGKQLMEQALAYGKEIGCRFAFVETMSFQAPEFYQSLGFNIEFKRDGYDQDTSFYYLRKDLDEAKTSPALLTPLTRADIPLIVKCFADANWPKPVTTFEMYWQEQERGKRVVWLAHCNGHVAGYVTLTWQSNYQPFRENDTPEIMDLNVLPPYRRRGIATQLLDAAEKEAATKCDVVGIGVGLYSGYGTAQKLYIKRGYIPDGRGITYDYHPIVPGDSTILDDDLVLWFTKKLR